MSTFSKSGGIGVQHAGKCREEGGGEHLLSTERIALQIRLNRDLKGCVGGERKGKMGCAAAFKGDPQRGHLSKLCYRPDV